MATDTVWFLGLGGGVPVKVMLLNFLRFSRSSTTPMRLNTNASRASRTANVCGWYRRWGGSGGAAATAVVQ